MAATELYERVRSALDRGVADLGAAAQNLKYIPTGQSKSGQPMPGTTAEDLGLRIVEINAVRRGLEMALGALDAEYRAMTQPVEDSGKQGEKEDEPIYG